LAPPLHLIADGLGQFILKFAFKAFYAIVPVKYMEV